MTVIAYDGKTLSTDKRAVQNGLIRTVTKMHRLSDGSVVAYAGTLTTGLEMVAWLEGGKKPEDFPERQKDDENFTLVVHLTKDGLVTYESSVHPVKFEDKYYASGSGRDFALAAMHCGKTSAEAVEITSLFENGCGNGVDSMKLLGVTNIKRKK